MAAPRVVYAKMAANLDRNRKIRRGGRDCRDVFLWVLRQVADRDAQGVIPSDDLLDLEFMADTLMCSVDEVKAGTEAAVRVGLLEIVDGEVRVCGWHDGAWGKRPMSGSERQKRYKTRVKGQSGDGGDGGDGQASPGDEGDEGSVTQRHPVTEVTGHVTSDASEQASKQVSNPLRHPDEAGGLFGDGQAEPAKKGRKKPALALPAGWLPNQEHMDYAAKSGLSVSAEAQKFRNHALQNDRKCVRWDSAFSNWLISAAERRGSKLPEKRADGWAVPPEAIANLKLDF